MILNTATLQIHCVSLLCITEVMDKDRQKGLAIIAVFILILAQFTVQIDHVCALIIFLRK